MKRSSNGRLFGLIAIIVTGLLAICCIAIALLMFSPDAGEETQLVQVEETRPIQVEKTQPAVQATQTPPRPTQPPAPTAGPADKTTFYRHPRISFQVIPASDQYEEGDNYVTFYDEANNIVDITIFELDGDLNQETMLDLANEVLDVVLVQTDWAKSFKITAGDPEQVNSGYIVYFTMPANQSGQKGGALFLRQSGRSLNAMTLLTPDLDGVAESWRQIVESFTPAGEAAAVVSPPPSQDSNLFDSGFRPEIDGFGFANYGNERGTVNLTPVEMRRLFGDRVCASLKDGKCTLKPAARQWMEEANSAMDGGHCEGMAVLSQLFYYNQIEPGQFGSARVNDLPSNNKALQREIAYWWVTQSTDPGSRIKVDESPREVVNTLLEAIRLGANAPEWWVLGIYQPDGSGGHAITPIGLENKGNGKYDILVYDNNWPDETRRLHIDTVANTWSYQASTNPDEAEALYEGDDSTDTLEVVAITPRLREQECTFCKGRGGTIGGSRNLAAPEVYEIYLDGSADLLITDENGKNVGYLDGKLVNEIDDAEIDTFRFGMDPWASDYEPVYRIPAGTAFAISVLGSKVTEPVTATVSVIGPGFFIDIEDIWIEPDEVDIVAIASAENFHGLVYQTDYIETPIVSIGVEKEDVAYAFIVQGTEVTGAEDTLNVGVNLDTGEFVLDSDQNTDPGKYDVYALRIDNEDFSAFGTSDLLLDPNTSIYLQYQSWLANGQPMQAEIDRGNDGEIDEVTELPDTSDEFEW